MNRNEYPLETEEDDMSTQVTPNFSDSQILKLLVDNYALAGDLNPLQSYRDQNLLLSNKDGQRFIIKISNTAESRVELEMQNSAMAHLNTKEFPSPQTMANQQGELISIINDQNKQAFCFRVLTFIEGKFYAELDANQHNANLWASLGEFIGKLSGYLNTFEHAGAYRYLEWDLAVGFSVCQDKKNLLNTEQRSLVDYFLASYQSQTLPLLSKLPCSIIHNDLNDHNILVDENNQLAGLIDFGDMVYSQTVNELAIGCAYALMEQSDPILALKTVVASYHQIKPLNNLELEVLFSLVALRLCTSVCNSASAIKAEPDNQYLLISERPAWQLLNQMRSLNAFAVLCQLRSACNLPIDSGRTNQEIIRFRQKNLSRNLSLSYQQPIKMVRGQGAYLYDEQGNDYLDMVNNVCHVGHCHPSVVAAGQTQMAKLNTNTRYLHDNIIDFSQVLLATLPEELSVCMLVNSGSEANELAFRLARNFTGSKQLLTVEGAYHGNTNACVEASPYKFDGPGGTGAEDYVHIVDLPDPYRGKYLGNTKETAEAYADSVSERINEIEAKGEKIGSFICESLQGVAGQIIMPNGYLKSAYEKVRAAGGVCIADEVQVGFGRVGSHMWAFETQGVVPDILTLGKPIGNGHPLAAVVTTKAIAEAFATGMEFFNTFGGNPVSCAIGSAVLKVIKDEKLQQNAAQVGRYMIEELNLLQQRFELIGDVRGLGLFIGIELVKDRETKAPATKQANEIVEFCKRNCILLSTEGKFHNIIKIKPPIVFSQQDAKRFITTFANALNEIK